MLTMACLPFTKAMFSPLPTLFFTLLTNLQDRHTRAWSTDYSSVGERSLACLIASLLPSLPCTKKFVCTLNMLSNATNTPRNKTGSGLQTKPKKWGTDRLNTCIQLPRQTQRPGYDSTEGKKEQRVKKKRRARARERDSRGDKDIDGLAGMSKHSFSHLVLQANFGTDDVGGTRHQTESQMFGRTGSWKSTFISPRMRLWEKINMS